MGAAQRAAHNKAVLAVAVQPEAELLRAAVPMVAVALAVTIVVAARVAQAAQAVLSVLYGLPRSANSPQRAWGRHD